MCLRKNTQNIGEYRLINEQKHLKSLFTNYIVHRVKINQVNKIFIFITHF